jgi:hypothetical protein
VLTYTLESPKQTISTRILQHAMKLPSVCSCFIYNLYYIIILLLYYIYIYIIYNLYYAIGQTSQFPKQRAHVILYPLIGSQDLKLLYPECFIWQNYTSSLVEGAKASAQVTTKPATKHNLPPIFKLCSP